MTDYTEQDINLLCNEVLSFIEAEEAKLLNWGFINTSITPDHLDLEFIERRLPARFKPIWSKWKDQLSIELFIKNLVDRKLLFEGKDGYRSRFAEGVRLLYLLRQRFGDDDWQNAPKLVSDIKIHLRKREYPKRNIPVGEILENISSGSLRYKVFNSLLHEGGKPLRLAKFQKESVLRITKSFRSQQDRGFVIGAGTGSGKTLAFYIPALSEIATHLSASKYWVKALAIYPRNELLKDQLKEVYSEAQKIGRILSDTKGRSIILGAYFGAVPYSAESLLKGDFEQWDESFDPPGWVCPFFSCPESRCDGEMVWIKEDVEKEITNKNNNVFGEYARLTCCKCSHRVSQKELLITRDQMRMQPPDILFTTTEMLNRRMSNAWEHELFGIDTRRPPKIVLLDEIHTYEGVHGAQVAYLLRRWSHVRSLKSQENVIFVGLSATINQAEKFFSRLTGLNEYQVDYIHPNSSDIICEGMEYNLVIKGDPVSGTSILSTSVQTVMLLGRILDPPNQPVSKRAYGQKVFAFTDKLDVINRWYHIETDAETYKNLSQYRFVDISETERWEKLNQEGQNWWIATEIGHDLLNSLQIDLTSSQYRGVDPNANLVIATSTLEVGYNDPDIGAIVQHKAPRGLASFIQRKGRAGRIRKMRPWTILVTSDYGRDRWAFQHSETLFDPLIPPIELPLNNFYIYKIQATYALMDWLTLKTKETKKLDVRRLLQSDENHRSEYKRADRDLLIEVLISVLKDELLHELKSFIIKALGFTEEERLIIDNILWRPPRSLMFHVVPSILRQLETDWQRVIPPNSQNDDWVTEKWGDFTSNSPLPAYLPSALFNDLNLPELDVAVEGNSGDIEKISLEQGVVEFTPGNITKRYVRRSNIHEAHWVFPEINENGEIPISLLSAEWDEISYEVIFEENSYTVVRPRKYNISQIPSNVRDTSSGYLRWKSKFVPRKLRGNEQIESEIKGEEIHLRKKSFLKEILHNVESYIQGSSTWVNVIRFAPKVFIDTRYKDGGNRKGEFIFMANGGAGAIGFDIDVDAIRFDYKSPGFNNIKNSEKWSDIYRDIGPEFFHSKISNDPRIKAKQLSVFTIEWLWQIFLSMLLRAAIKNECSLQLALKKTRDNYADLLDETFGFIFQSQTGENKYDSEPQGRLKEKLYEILIDEEIQNVLFDNSSVLWDDSDEELKVWLLESFQYTVGSVLYSSLISMVPDIDSDDLHMDVVGNNIWISEGVPGGIGLIYKIRNRVSRNPREFELVFLHNLRNCEREQFASYLTDIVNLLSEDNQKLSNIFENLRRDNDIQNIKKTKQKLTKFLEDVGIPISRQLIVAINNKLLRPNSSNDTDELIVALHEFKINEERRLGCSVNPRVFASIAYEEQQIRQLVDSVLRRINDTEKDPTQAQIYNLIQSLLWMDCRDSCPACIEQYHHYQEVNYSSRKLLFSTITEEISEVNYNESGWKNIVINELGDNYHVRVVVSQSDMNLCKKEIINFLIEPIEVGFQFHHPIIEGIFRQESNWKIDLILPSFIGD